VQLDDTNFAFLCDPRSSSMLSAGTGTEPDEVPERFANLINSVIAGRPAGMVACDPSVPGQFRRPVGGRGRLRAVAEVSSTRSTWMRTFSNTTMNARATSRRCVFPEAFAQENRARAGQHQIAGARNPKMHSNGASKQRQNFVPLENLCLSPQCGFASTYRGNPIS